jgi:predicted aspartyl protease
MVVDTGGSIMLALDQTVADEIGLRSVAPASVRGVAGKEQTGQALIEELRIGTIRCRRVVTRTFDVRKSIMGAADGILGTGIFAEGRLTLDFAGGQLVVAPSSAEPGRGQATEVRIAADAKLVAPIRIEGRPGTALLDTGADVVALSPVRMAELFPNRERQVFDVPLALGVGQGNLPQITLTEGVRLELGGRTFENLGGLGLNILDDTLSPIIGIQTDVLVGMTLFREMRSLTVDFARCRLWIEWLGPGERRGGHDSEPAGE